MKILIVEDREDKLNSIKNVINSFFDKSEIKVSKTYFSAKHEILNDYFDLVIMDMFLPDAKDNENLYGLAGKDLIFDMEDEDINIPVLVVTQYTESCSIGKNDNIVNINIPLMLENQNYGKALDCNSIIESDITFYQGLHEYLIQIIPFYLGIIFYSNKFPSWRNNLKYFLNKIKMEIRSEKKSEF